jgi:DNA-binding NarL/FixJ family response regulator
LRRRGETRAAIDHLRSAREILSRLGALPFLADCDAELEACGLRSPEASAGDLLALTPHEEAVARLVASGLSNREAAARLYVSAKAVEYHLGHIYAKLGITSRRRLAERIGHAERSPGPD